jgi:hypothetical protein
MVVDTNATLKTAPWLFSDWYYVGLQAQPVTECIVERPAARIAKGQAHSPFSHLGTKQNKRSSTPLPVRRARRSFFF